MRASSWVVAAVLLIVGLALAPSAAQAQYTYYRDDHVRHRPVHLGVSAVGGGQIHTNGGQPDGVMRLGLDLIGTLVPGFALGFTRLGVGFGYSDVEGVIFTGNATPTFEFSFFPGSDVQLFLQLGATLGLAAPTNVRPLGFNAAITTAIGVRIWIGNTFTLGFLLGNDIGATNPGVRSYFGGPLGIGELSFFGGLELGWNL